MTFDAGTKLAPCQRMATVLIIINKHINYDLTATHSVYLFSVYTLYYIS